MDIGGGEHAGLIDRTSLSVSRGLYGVNASVPGRIWDHRNRGQINDYEVRSGSKGSKALEPEADAGCSKEACSVRKEDDSGERDDTENVDWRE